MILDQNAFPASSSCRREKLFSPPTSVCLDSKIRRVSADRIFSVFERNNMRTENN